MLREIAKKKKERKIMKFLFKVKSGRPLQRKTALRQRKKKKKQRQRMERRTSWRGFRCRRWSAPPGTLAGAWACGDPRGYARAFARGFRGRGRFEGTLVTAAVVSKV